MSWNSKDHVVSLWRYLFVSYSPYHTSMPLLFWFSFSSAPSVSTTQPNQTKPYFFHVVKFIFRRKNYKSLLVVVMLYALRLVRQR